MTDVRDHLEAYVRGYLLATAADLAEAIEADVMALAGYCHQPHPDRVAWPDVRCSRHKHHAGDHGAFPKGPALAAVPIRWEQP